MKKKEPADPLLDEIETAQRRFEAEFDNDPAKLRPITRRRRALRGQAHQQARAGPRRP